MKVGMALACARRVVLAPVAAALDALAL